jgi:hypothetical protein
MVAGPAFAWAVYENYGRSHTLTAAEPTCGSAHRSLADSLLCLRNLNTGG